MTRLALTNTFPLLRPARGAGWLLLVLILIAGPALAQSTLRPAGVPVQLLDDASAFAHPTWSPDGNRLALTRPGYTGLWTVGADGEGLRQITDDAAAGFGFAWSPDGQALLARVARFDGMNREHAVRVYDLDSDTAEDLTDFRSQMPTLPRWSPDGRAVILATADGFESFEREAGTQAQITAPDASAFITLGTTLTAVRTQGGTTDRTPLVTDRRIINATASPNRGRVAFEVVGGHLHVINADGSGLIDLGPGNRPTWSPDGDWIAFMRTTDDGEAFTSADLWAVRADGSALVALTQTPDALEMNPSWSPDGTAIAFDDLRDGAVYLLPIAR